MRRPSSTFTRRLIATLTLLTSAAAATACRAPDPTPSTPSTPDTARIAPPTTGAADPFPTDSSGRPTGWTVCHNTVKRYSVSYPAGWHTASVGPDDACTSFDPAPFTVVDGAPALQTQQLWAFYGTEGAALFVADLFPRDFFTITAQDDVTIAGRHGLRYTVTTLPPRGPSGPTYPVGSTIYGYVIEEGGHSLDVATWGPPGEPTLATRRHVVDLAVTTIAFG